MALRFAELKTYNQGFQTCLTQAIREQKSNRKVALTLPRVRTHVRSPPVAGQSK